MSKIVDTELSSEILNQSHIGRTRHFDQIESDDPVSRRIFRQGFEFIESADFSQEKSIRLGQNGSELFRTLILYSDRSELARRK